MWEDGKVTWEFRKDLIEDGLREHVKKFDASRRKGGDGWFAANHEKIIAEYIAKHAKGSAKKSASKGSGRRGSMSKATAQAVAGADEAKADEDVGRPPAKSRSKSPKRAASPARAKKSPAKQTTQPTKPSPSPKAKAKRAASPRRTKAVAEVKQMSTEEEEERRMIGDTVSRAVAEAAASVVRAAVPTARSASKRSAGDDLEWQREDPVPATSALLGVSGEAADEEGLADEEVGGGARASSGVATAFGAASRIRFHGGGRPITPAMTLALAVVLFLVVGFAPDNAIATVAPASITVTGVRTVLAAIFVLLAPFHVVFTNSAGESSSAAQVRYTLAAMIAALSASHPQWRLGLTASFPHLEAFISLSLAVSLLWVALAAPASRTPSFASWAVALAAVTAVAVASHPGTVDSATAALGTVFARQSTPEAADGPNSGSVAAGFPADLVFAATAAAAGVAGWLWATAWAAVATVWAAATSLSHVTAGVHAAAAVAAVARALESRRWQDALAVVGTVGLSHPAWVEGQLTQGLAAASAASTMQASSLAMGLSFSAVAVACDDDNAGEEASGRIAEVQGYDE